MLSGWDFPLVEDASFSRGPDKGTTDLGPGCDRWNYVNRRKTRGRVIFNNLIVGRGNVKVAVNPTLDLPSLVMFRDSFEATMIPFLIRSFSRIVSVNSWHLWDELIESEKPDFVLWEVCERYLLPVPFESKAESFESMFKMSPEEIRAIDGQR